MKKVCYSIAFILLSWASIELISCTRNNSLAAAPNAMTTPQSYTVSILSGSLGGYSGYYYSSSAGSNNTSTGLFSLTAHVGDTVNLPAASIHPLYFLDSTGTCVYSGVTSPPSAYTFTATGMYYFHCGFHAISCNPNNTTCNATSCAGLAGVITVQ
jgi:hypothetical protein